MHRKLLYLIVIIAVAARLFSLAVLPETAYTDALHHSMISREVLEQSGLGISSFTVPPPLYYLITVPAYVLSALPVEMPFVKFFPIVFTALLLLSSYLLFREIFPGRWPLALSFVAVFPWLVRYASTNYTGILSAALIVFSLYLFRKLVSTDRRAYLAGLSLLIPAIALSSLAAIVLAFLFFIAVLIYICRNRLKFGFNAIAAFFVVAVLLSGLWYLVLYLNTGTVLYGEVGFLLSGSDAGSSLESTTNNAPMFDLFGSHLSLYDFPPLESFQRIPLLKNLPIELVAAVFTLLVLPLTILILYGMLSTLKQKTNFNYLVVGLTALGLLLAVLATMKPSLNGVMYTRYLIPVMPLLGMFFASGYYSLKRPGIRRIAAVSFILFSVYALAYSSISALYFQDVFQQHSGLFEYAKTLPSDSKVYSKVNGRAIGFFAGLDHGEIAGLYTLPQDEVYENLTVEGFTHLAVSCYRNPWQPETLASLEADGRLTQLYKDGCATLYRLN